MADRVELWGEVYYSSYTHIRYRHDYPGLPPVTDRQRDIASVSRLSSVKELWAFHGSFTDDHLDVLSHVPSIVGMNLQGSSVTDEGIRYLVRLPSLAFLRLKDTGLTDSATVDLGRITTLTELQIQSTSTTDAGLANLTGLKSLEQLITDGKSLEALGELSRALPQAELLDKGHAVFFGGQQQ